MSPNIKLNGCLSILIFGYVIILHSYLGHFCLLLEHIFDKYNFTIENYLNGQMNMYMGYSLYEVYHEIKIRKCGI